ncbi:MAG: HAMP domain-containing sensor histidine kinase [bacterium]
MSQQLLTEFAPAERASKEELQRQSSYFSGLPLLSQLLDGVPDIMVILNQYRQIVFSNTSLLRVIGSDNGDSVCGLRPGEALECLHAFERDGGCGTTEFCKTCGAVNAIITSLHGKREIRECRLIQRETGEAMDLRVCATPFALNGEQFIFFSVTDISHEKRRAALERIFFHDVLNTAGGLLGFAGLLKDADPEDIGEYRDEIYALAEQIVEEIKAQRELTAAESNELSIHPTRVISTALLQETVHLYMNHGAAKGRSIQIDPHAEKVEFTSDRTLVGRVLGNMLKNALEASQPGETVTLGCNGNEESILFWVHNPTFMPRYVQLQLFQRSFSTKGTGRGLGTYSIKLLTERYLKGNASFTTSQQDGTTFIIDIPLRLHA